MKQVIYCLFICSALCSCNGSSSDPGNIKNTDASFDVSKVKQSIESTNKKFADAVVKGDSASVVNMYHSDAIVYPPNMSTGKKTIMGTMAAGVSKSGIKTFSLNTTEVTGNSEEVVETGTYEMGDGSKTVDKGKYIVVWKPENGEWKLWRDIWNSDNSPAPTSK